MKPLDLNSDFKIISNCRICNSNQLQEILDLGIQPLANNLRSLEDQNLEKNFPNYTKMLRMYCDSVISKCKSKVNVSRLFMDNRY